MIMIGEVLKQTKSVIFIEFDGTFVITNHMQKDDANSWSLSNTDDYLI